MMKKSYGIAIKERSTPVSPVEMKLTGSEGTKAVINAAKRVIATHEKVIKALAKR
ncbi:MAG: hypothetical protein ABSD12_30540 [Paraburkholderia sp.]